MSKTIDYYFTVLSTWSFIGTGPFREIVTRHEVEVRHRPMDILTLFRETGGLPVGKRSPQRQANRLVEMQRWRAKRGLNMNLHPKHFPFRAALADGMVIAAAQNSEADAAHLADACMHAVWAEERDCADPATLVALAGEQGLDGAALLAAAQAEDMEERYQANTDAAIAAGVFGAPTWVLDGVPFWGQDRLDFLDEALAANGPAIDLPSYTPA